MLLYCNFGEYKDALLLFILLNSVHVELVGRLVKMVMSYKLIWILKEIEQIVVVYELRTS